MIRFGLSHTAEWFVFQPNVHVIQNRFVYWLKDLKNARLSKILVRLSHGYQFEMISVQVT